MVNWGFFVARLNEASTWRGIALCLTAIGIQISPDHLNQIAAVGMAVCGSLGVFLPDTSVGAVPKPPIIQVYNGPV